LATDLYEVASGVACEYKAVVAGGLGGAGKTTVLGRHAVINLTEYLVINPDDIKEQMARRGLIPHVEGLSPMEASDLVHEESSVIAKRLAHRAYAAGKNLVWAVTMSTGNSTMKRIEALRSAGYAQVHGVFVDIPVEVSVRRADTRHREGHDAYLTGNGLGGRYVAAEVIRSRADEEWGSKNRRNFDQVKDRFDAWLVYHNSLDYEDPVVIDSGGAHDSVGRRTAR
jgi:predicted ABC-type ATPase